MQMSEHDELAERLLKAIQHPNLVTISALANSHPEAGRINAVAAQLFQLATLIRSAGVWHAQKAEKTVLAAGIEKGLAGGKGHFNQPNPLNAQAFEVLVSKDGARGKVLWYADTLFANAQGTFQWMIRESTSLYTLRRLENQQLIEETLELWRSGAGEYERRCNRKRVRKVCWKNDGTLVCDESP